MKTIAWLCIAALACAWLMVSIVAHGETGVSAAWVRERLGRLPVPAKDRSSPRSEFRAMLLDQFAEEIARVSGARARPREYAALLITLGSAETNFETRLVMGECKPYECDRGRARGAFQNQNVSFVSDLWGGANGDVRAQVAMADRALSRSVVRCSAFAPFPAHVFRAYKGGAAGSCSWELRDEHSRVALFRRIVK